MKWGVMGRVGKSPPVHRAFPQLGLFWSRFVSVVTKAPPPCLSFVLVWEDSGGGQLEIVTVEGGVSQIVSRVRDNLGHRSHIYVSPHRN